MSQGNQAAVSAIPKKKYFENFFKYRFLISELVRKNIKLQYRNSILGMFWTCLQPLLTMIVLSFVFGNMLGRSSNVGNYSVYLLTGRLLFDFYSGATKKAMRSIRGNASIIKKVYVPKYAYPLSNIFSTFITFLISLIVLVVVMLYYNIFTAAKVAITPYVFVAVVPIIILMALAMGVGMILASLEVFFRDIDYLYDVFCLLLFYVTPIIYDIDSLGLGRWAILLKANPLYGIINMFRASVLFGSNFWAYWSWDNFFYTIGFSAVCLLVGFLLFYKNQDKFILHI